MTRTGLCIALVTLLAGTAPTGQPAAAQPVADFYKGKQVSVLIGFGPGGANDAWARALARHMGKHIPGHPTLVPQNMPGAGTLKLANHLYNVAAKDGTVFGLINRGIPLEPLLGGDAQFDPLQMTWIGSPDKDTTVCAARKDAQVQTMQDLFAKELVVGATGSGADTAIYPEFLAEFLGMKFRTIKGYPGSNEIVLAMERGEVQGICVAYESLARQRLARDGQINILFQAALQKDPGIPGDIPLALELARSDAERKALELFLTRVALGRPFVAPPGLAPERAAALRAAFLATMADPDFVEETKKLRLAVDPIPGETLARTLTEIYRTPKEVVARVAETLGRVSK
ncbi:MAG TPA: tripartite tricarboxylate transporter substrate-binding protein [Hyphomicrobiaceae bacterium]|jgi:tripartite-type tricarboxylate transporter receptor subunit TctC|nr:tripartite tricarboxylate transporter substrate-binding protein [Hyphomicrobiaceae bacterium]